MDKKKLLSASLQKLSADMHANILFYSIFLW